MIAQPLGQPVVRDRPHDHALLQQRGVDRARRLPTFDEHEVAVRRARTRTPSDLQAGIELREPVRRSAARLSSTYVGVGERGDRRRLRERVDVERLADAVQHVGDAGAA